MLFLIYIYNKLLMCLRVKERKMRKITVLVRVCCFAVGLILVDQELLTGISGMIKNLPQRVNQVKLEGVE